MATNLLQVEVARGDKREADFTNHCSSTNYQCNMELHRPPDTRKRIPTHTRGA